MKSNKEMTMREFNYSHELKLAMNHANNLGACIAEATEYATGNDRLLLSSAYDTLLTLKTDIRVALREMEYDS